MRILFAGTPEVGAAVLTALLESSHDVVGVLTQPDAPTGRGRKLAASPVAKVAEDNDVPLLKAESVRSESTQTWIRERQADAAAVVAYGQFLDSTVLSLLPLGWFNLHFSLLPAFRGAAPVQRAIESGVTDSGVSVFRIDEGLDTGEIAAQEPYSFGATETSGEALESMAVVGSRIMVRVFDQLENGVLTFEPQGESGASHAAKLSPSEARINPNRDATTVGAHIRAFSPQPGAFLEYGGLRVKVLGIDDAQAPPDLTLEPGTWGVTKKHLFLGTSTQPVAVATVAPAGKKAMRAADWARGARIQTGDAIDTPLNNTEGQV